MSWMTLPSLQGCTRGVPESATLTTTKKRTDSMRILMREPCTNNPVLILTLTLHRHENLLLLFKLHRIPVQFAGVAQLGELHSNERLTRC